MEYRASHRFARISAKKVRASADLIRGLEVNRALNLLSVDPARGSALFAKVLRSAVANAGQDENVDVNGLVVREARVDQGPLLQGRMRWRPASMGRSMPIRRRTAHIKVVVAEKEQG